MTLLDIWTRYQHRVPKDLTTADWHDVVADLGDYADTAPDNLLACAATLRDAALLVGEITAVQCSRDPSRYIYLGAAYAAATLYALAAALEEAHGTLAEVMANVTPLVGEPV